MTTSISSWTMKHLEADVVFGIGALFLYILVPTALFANEVRMAKNSDDTSGTASILDAIAQGTMFIVSWLLGVTLFVLVIMILAPTGSAATMVNPIIGIWDFWDVDWMNSSVINSINTSSQIYLDLGDPGVEQAHALVLILSIAKVLDILLLFVLLILSIKLSMSLPMYKMRRTSHSQMNSDLDLSAIMTYLMVFMTGMILFNFLLNLDNMLLQSLFDYATSKLAGISFSGDVNILDNLWNLIRNAHDNI